MKYITLILLLISQLSFSQDCGESDYNNQASVVSIGSTSASAVIQRDLNDTFPKLINRNGLENSIEFFQKARQGIFNERFVVALFGDSNSTNEQNASGFTGIPKERLWDKGGYIGTGYHGATLQGNPNGRWKSKSGFRETRRYITTPQGHDPSGTAEEMDSSAVTSFNSLNGQAGSTYENADIFYLKGSGDFQYTILGSPPVFVENSTGSNLGIIEYQHGSVTNAAITIESKEDGFTLYGVNTEIEGNGVLIHKFALSGWNVTHLEIISRHPIWKQIIAHINPNLVIDNLGSNWTGAYTDGINDIGPIGHALSHKNLLNRIDSLTTVDTEFLVLGFSDKDRFGYPPPIVSNEQYHKGTYQMCIENDFGYASLFAYHDHAIINFRRGVTSDNVHYTNPVGTCSNYRFLSWIFNWR